VSEIIDLGRREYGSEQFDADSQAVAEKLGNRTQEFMVLARQMDHPHRIIKHLADNTNALDAISKMPTPRAIVELARIESRSASYGHVQTFAQPAWKSPEMKGRVSDADWATNGGANLSDREWNREFDRRWAERRARRR
jgi:hypothetical protein